MNAPSLGSCLLPPSPPPPDPTISRSYPVGGKITRVRERESSFSLLSFTTTRNLWPRRSPHASRFCRKKYRPGRGENLHKHSTSILLGAIHCLRALTGIHTMAHGQWLMDGDGPCLLPFS